MRDALGVFALIAVLVVMALAAIYVLWVVVFPLLAAL